MKIIKDIKLYFITLLLMGIIFPLSFAALGLIMPRLSEGLPVYRNGRLTGFENIGQTFKDDKYFWGRPSENKYNAMASGGSNKGVADKEYLSSVTERINYFLKKNPDIKKEQIPSDLITESGSGLDPHISVQAAIIQIPRVSKARNLGYEIVNELVLSHVEKPLAGLFGPERVNVLKLNLALDEIKK